MKNTTTIAVVVIAIILVVGFIAYSAGPTIAARGTSNIDVVPDEVSVNINIETHNETAQLAQDQNKLISDLLTTELIKAGFDRDELKFANYNVYQEYDYDYRGGSTPKGYVVYQQLVVKTNNTDKVPAIVDAAIYSGALISYIDFQISDKKQSEIKAQALEQASKDAETKASAIAKGQGKSLGRLVSLQNDEMPIFQPYRYFDSGVVSGAVDKAAMEVNAVSAQKASISLSPTDQTISASVSAQYKLSWF
jgi:uncharacterized protein YggE